MLSSLALSSSRACLASLSSRRRLRHSPPSSPSLRLPLSSLQDTLLDQAAPFPNPLAKLIGDAMHALRGLARDDPSFPDLVACLTENFDKFPDVVVDERDPDAASRVKRPGAKTKNDFVGYTYRRAKDGTPVLAQGPAGGGGSGKKLSGGASARGHAHASPSPAPASGGGAGGAAPTGSL